MDVYSTKTFPFQISFVRTIKAHIKAIFVGKSLHVEDICPLLWFLTPVAQQMIIIGMVAFLSMSWE